jgi:hypothetical protein
MIKQEFYNQLYGTIRLIYKPTNMSDMWMYIKDLWWVYKGCPDSPPKTPYPLHESSEALNFLDFVFNYEKYAKKQKQEQNQLSAFHHFNNRF